MGTCSASNMKKSLRGELRTLKQKRSLTPTPNKSTTQQNSIKQQPKSVTYSCVNIKTETNSTSLTNINYFLVYRNTNFSSFYTLIKKETEDNPFIVIQHNMTGIQRIIKTYQISDTKYISQLIKHQLNHPNLIQQYEIYEDHRKYHVVEENNEKITILNKKSYKNEFDIAFIFNQMVEVIDYLHHEQLTHGNLTLNSFAILGDKYLKLTDLHNLFMKKQMSFEEQHYLAPEGFYHEEFTQERDVWSLGVILYQMLYHELPFKESTISLLKREITGSEINLDNRVSEEANSLLKQLLDKNPVERIKIQKISDSAWLKKQAVFLKEEQIKFTLLRLQKSKKINILQAYLLKFVINTYPPEKLREIYSVFRSLDLDNDGYFSLQELLSSYSEFVENSHDNNIICKAIFMKVDMDRDGKITFSEFILYAMDRSKLLEEDVLENSFKLLQNRKHVITPEQLSTQYSLDKEFFVQLICDCTSKEYLTFKNFKELITLTA